MQDMSAVEISLLNDADDLDVEAIGRLLRQVSSSAAPLTAEHALEVLRAPSTSVLVARLDGRLVGMALLLTLSTFAGGSGYIEEVVVDEAVRGQRVGKALIAALLSLAAEKGLRFVDLTSRPAREAANGPYQSLGFEQRQTNGYRHNLSRLPG
jgi:ribosomal protein S18 acetylase RimI-like enzyme